MQSKEQIKYLLNQIRMTGNSLAELREFKEKVGGNDPRISRYERRITNFRSEIYKPRP